MSSSKVTNPHVATPRAKQQLTRIDPPKFDLESYISNYDGMLFRPLR